MAALCLLLDSRISLQEATDQVRIPGGYGWLVVATLASSAGQLRAQTPRSEWLRVRPNAVLRVDSGGPAVIGVFQTLEPNALMLAGPCWIASGETLCGAQAFEVNLRSIRSVFVRRTQTGRGLLLGTALGAALGAGIGLGIGSTGDMKTHHTVIAASATLGLIGGSIGTVVGSRVHKWRPLPVPAFNR